MAEHFVEEGVFTTKNSVTIKKYRSKQCSIPVYFCNVDSQFVNGYFSFGIDKPEACGIESLLFQLDSSGGLLPRPMRGDMLKPAWQFHGAENPLADRDQSCYACCALGESAFLGTFACCVYLLQNFEAVFEMHGFQSAERRALCKQTTATSTNEGGDPASTPEGNNNNAVKEKVEETTPEPDAGSGDNNEPQLSCHEYYCLSEAGEGAMAWETTLQAMFPGSSVFWNRLLFEGKNKMSDRMRDCFDRFYRPENLTVVITGTIEDHDHILQTLHDYELDYTDLHPKASEFVRPWTSMTLPPFQAGTETEVRFIPRNYKRIPSATICLGWRGSPSTDIQTTFALKCITAYASVQPLWNKFIIPGLAQRISWCLLEYSDTCSLVTIHGVKNRNDMDSVISATKELFKDLAADNDILELKDIHAMVERVKWHNVRELESEPSLILASLITKAELYGVGEKKQLEKRFEPDAIFQDLLVQPLSYWKKLVSKYFLEHGFFITKIVPRSFEKIDEEVQPEEPATKPEETYERPGEHSFIETSKRASSRPRRTTNNPVAEEGYSKVQEEMASTIPKDLEKSLESLKVDERDRKGHLEMLMQSEQKPFPFDDFCQQEAERFSNRLRQTTQFLDQITTYPLRNCQIESYSSDDEKQHPKFPVDKLPFCTLLENTNCSFVYITLILDTTHLNEQERSQVAVITSAIGAILCPRPPGLDTDFEIKNPTEFNPPKHISDSQVSLGLNGEAVQNIFSTLIVRPDHYNWAIGMLHHFLYAYEFNPRFLQFVCQEAVKGLAYNYRKQTAEVANYEYFDASEINMYCLLKQIYKEDSNARLFVGRRRLDLINCFLKLLDESPEMATNSAQETFRRIVDDGKILVQIATNVDELVKSVEDPIAPWDQYFGVTKKSVKYADNAPKAEKMFVNMPTGQSGTVVRVQHIRPPCLTLAIPIDATADYFPALCITMQLFSVAQKWILMILEEDDYAGQPMLRMPCSFPSIITLNLESPDVIGELCMMKIVINENWEWLNGLLTASKLMLVNEPACGTEISSAQNTIAMTLLTKLANQPHEMRRDIMMKCLQVTMDDVKAVIRDHFRKLFDPKQCWYSLMTPRDCEDSTHLIKRLENEFGFSFKEQDLFEACTTL